MRTLTILGLIVLLFSMPVIVDVATADNDTKESGNYDIIMHPKFRGHTMLLDRRSGATYYLYETSNGTLYWKMMTHGHPDE